MPPIGQKRTLIEATMNQSERISELINSLESIPEQDLRRVPLLTQLLVEEGHDRHEDLVLELGLIGDASAIPAISKAIRIEFLELVRWNNLHEFQRKCAYALARIGTDASRAALEEIAASADPFLRDYGREGLEHWPMPYRRD